MHQIRSVSTELDATQQFVFKRSLLVLPLKKVEKVTLDHPDEGSKNSNQAAQGIEGPANDNAFIKKVFPALKDGAPISTLALGRGDPDSTSLCIRTILENAGLKIDLKIRTNCEETEAKAQP